MASASAGWIIILNGAPRSGKSSMARAIQETCDGVWMNLGVDTFMAATPARYRPGIGLRPGGERPDLEPLVSTLYAALYESVAAHSRLGLNVIVDVGHHDIYSRPLDILADRDRRLAGLPVVLVGVRCPLATIMDRRRNDQPGRAGLYLKALEGGDVPEPVRLWQTAVHEHHAYDLEVDTSTSTPQDCAALIEAHLYRRGPHKTSSHGQRS